MGRRNTFSRALRQLKSEEVDKKIQLVETMPTNNTMGVFSTAPDGYEVGTTTVSRETWGEADLDFDADGESDGTDTTGLFETDGTPKAAMPPGDTSYILGPMSAMYYSWWSGGTTTVGYIRQSDRKMVNLGTISGKLHNWDGASFNSYGQLTLEQAQWFKDVKKKDDAGNDPDNANYRAFYPGPPSNTPDANGRYLCTITGAPKDVTTTQNVEIPHSPTEKGEMSADDNFAALADRAMKHGLSKGRTDEMTEEELQKFVDMMDSLDADIEKYSAEEQAARREMRNIAIGFGVDVALTLFGGAILKGVAKGASFGINALRNANRAKNIAKAADVAYDLNRARQQTQLNNLQKFAKTLKGSSKAEYIDDLADLKYFKQHERNQSAVNKLYNKLNNPANYGQKGKLLNTLDDFGGTTRTTTTTTKTSQKTFKQHVKDYVNKGKNKQVPGEDTASFKRLVQNDIDQMGKFVKKGSRNKLPKDLKPSDFEGGPLPMNVDQLKQFLQGKGGLTWSFSRGTSTGPTPLFRQTPRLIKQGLQNSVDTVNKSPLGKALVKEIGNSSLVKVAPHLAKASIEGAKPITRAVASKTVQQLVGTSTDESGTETAGKVLNVVTSVLPKNIKSPAKIFLGYLTGTIEGNAGDAIDADDQAAAWENLNIDPSSNSLSVGGHMSNVFGGEPLSHLKVDKDGNAVLKFNFAPTKNEDEFATHPGKYSPTQQKILKMLGPYSADLNIQIPGGPWTAPISGATGPLASLATVMAKGLDKITPDDSILGGIKTGRSLNGDIKIPMDKLKDIKPDVYEYLKSQQNTSSKWMPNKDVKTAMDFDNKGGFSVQGEWQPGTPGQPGYKNIKIKKGEAELYDYTSGTKQNKKDLNNIGDEIKTKLDNAIQNISKAKKTKSNIKTTTYGKALRVAHYEPQAELILESKASRVLKNLKKPVVLPDTKQKKYKVKPGARMRGMDTLVGDVKPQEPYKKPQKVWTRGKNSQNYNARESQEKKNQVLQYVGASMDHWDYMTETIRKQGAKLVTNYKDHDYLYDYWLGGKKNKITRKEEVDGDFLVFMEDENGKKTTILQSKLNAQVSQNKEKEAFDEYYKLNPKKEPIPYENDPLFKKVSKRLKTVIDYKDKPATKGYPNEPPPKQIDGWHPDFGKRYKYDKLDPVSAKAMPKTGNPEIDANVEKAARKPK